MTLLKGCYSYLGMYPALSFVEAGCRRGPNLMEDGWYFDDFPRKKLNFYRCKVSTCRCKLKIQNGVKCACLFLSLSFTPVVRVV